MTFIVYGMDICSKKSCLIGMAFFFISYFFITIFKLSVILYSSEKIEEGGVTWKTGLERIRIMRKN